MAISWGAWDYGTTVNSQGFRVGVEVTNTAVTTSSTSVTFTYKWYVQNQYTVDDIQTLTFSGTGITDGSISHDNDSNTHGHYELWATRTFTHTYTTYGTSPGTRTVRADLSGVYNAANPYKAFTITIPARPYAAPNAPSAVSEVRNSDAQATVTWTRNVTTQRPYASQLVRMRTYTGNTWGPYVDVATVSGTATSYVKTGLLANRIYQFAVRANNTAGSSVFAYDGTPYVKMTPAAPTGVVSAIDASGSTITTTWANQAYIDAGVTWAVERSVAGGAFAEVATGIAQATPVYVDASPGVGTNQYRVKAVQSIGTLSSAFATGNSVTTVATPLAASNLSPNSIPVDLNDDVTLTWQHNHGGDGAPQSAFSIQYSTDSGSSWTDLVVAEASAVSSYEVPGTTLPNGFTYLWQVQTQGIASEGFGPWSTSAVFAAVTKPTVTLTEPLDAAEVSELPMLVEWVYNQDELSPQTAWEIEVADDVTNLVVGAKSGTDAAEATSLTPLMVDGGVYRVGIRVRAGNGLWSNWAISTITFALLPPVAVAVFPEYDRCTGVVVLSMSPGEAAPGESVAAEHAKVERKVPGGNWITLVENIELPADFLDVVPAVTGINTYRITSISPVPSYSVGPEIEVFADGGDRGCGLWTFINYGPGFTKVLRVQGEPQITSKAGRARATHSFLGRSKPVLMVGEDTNRGISFSGKLHYDDWIRKSSPCEYDSAPEEWIQAALESEVVCYRDHTGRRIFGELSGVQVGEILHKGFGDVSFDVTEADYVEAGGIIGLESTIVIPTPPPPEGGCNYIEADGPTLPAGEPEGTIWRNTSPAV